MGKGYGEEGTLRGWPTPPSLPRATDLERPRPLGLLPAKVELSSNRQAHKEPVTEAEVVDEQENILHSEVDERHGALEGEGGAGVSSVTTTGTPGDSTIQPSAPVCRLLTQLRRITSGSLPLPLGIRKLHSPP